MRPLNTKHMILAAIAAVMLYSPDTSSIDRTSYGQAPAWTQRLPWKLINRISDKHNIDRNLVAAIIQKESSGNGCATRYESHFSHLHRPFQYSNELEITYHAEVQHQKTSFGYMQVMGAVARELGYKRNLWNLCSAQDNISLGVRKLKQLSKRYADPADVIAAYNAGTPRKNASDRYENQQYVDQVMKFYLQVVNGV